MHTVLGIAEMVKDGHTLDQIKGIREKQMEEARQRELNMAKPNHNDESSAFSWTTNKIVMQVRQKYQS